MTCGTDFADRCPHSCDSRRVDSHRPDDDELRHRVEHAAGFACRAGRRSRVRARSTSCRGPVAGVLDRLARQDQVADPLDLVRRRGSASSDRSSARCSRGAVRRKWIIGSVIFPFSTSMPSVLPTVRGVADDVEDVVLDLERVPSDRPYSSSCARPASRSRRRTWRRAGSRWRTGWRSCGVMISRYVSSSRSRLLRLSIWSSSPSQTWLVVRAISAAGELRVEAGAQVVAVADQVVAEQHGRLVAAEVVDRRALAAQLGLVQHVVVHERGHVDHLDDGRDRRRARRSARRTALPASSTQRRPEHLPAEAADVLDQRVDARRGRWPAPRETAARPPRAAAAMHSVRLLRAAAPTAVPSLCPVCSWAFPFCRGIVQSAPGACECDQKFRKN